MYVWSGPCGTFECVPPDELRRLARFVRDDRIAGVSTAKGRILSVETFDPAVDAVEATVPKAGRFVQPEDRPRFLIK
jgi:hypothetical protein